MKLGTSLVTLALLIAVSAGLAWVAWGGPRLRRPSTEEPLPETATPGQPVKWVGCDICQYSFMDAVARAYQRKTGVVIDVKRGGATRGIRDVAAGKADMGGSCRHCLDVAEERGVKLVPAAWDALVVVVHESNRVENITVEQLRGVYSGRITSWKELGGNDVPLQLFVRRGKYSGVGESSRLLIFGDLNKDYTDRARVFRSSGPLEEALEEAPDALAITGISSAHRRPRLKVLDLEGKSPTRENLITGQYLFYRPLYLTVPDKPGPAVERFAEFLYSEEGQEVIRATGTVTLAEGKGLWDNFKKQMKDAVARQH
jgi:phosphate transport system substrate-binding protein